MVKQYSGLNWKGIKSEDTDRWKQTIWNLSSGQCSAQSIHNRLLVSKHLIPLMEYRWWMGTGAMLDWGDEEPWGKVEKGDIQDTRHQLLLCYREFTRIDRGTFDWQRWRCVSLAAKYISTIKVFITLCPFKQWTHTNRLGRVPIEHVLNHTSKHWLIITPIPAAFNFFIQTLAGGFALKPMSFHFVAEAENPLLSIKLRQRRSSTGWISRATMQR